MCGGCFLSELIQPKTIFLLPRYLSPFAFFVKLFLLCLGQKRAAADPDALSAVRTFPVPGRLGQNHLSAVRALGASCATLLRRRRIIGMLWNRQRLKRLLEDRRLNGLEVIGGAANDI